MGRPSKYETEIKPHLDDIRKAVEAGATNDEIAKAFGINISTLYEYKKRYKDFSDAFARGREKVIFDIKAALLRKALGYDYEEEKRVGKKDKDGDKIVLIETYKKHMPPSETAAAMLLRNYDKSWLDKDVTSTDLKRQEVELRKAIAEANTFDLDLKEN